MFTFDYIFNVNMEDMVYKSPIQILQQEFEMSMNKCFEDETFKAIQKFGISVDKEELIKALKYDREQFEKGRECGKREIRKELFELIKDYDEYLPTTFINKLKVLGLE